MITSGHKHPAITPSSPPRLQYLPRLHQRRQTCTSSVKDWQSWPTYRSYHFQVPLPIIPDPWDWDDCWYNFTLHFLLIVDVYGLACLCRVNIPVPWILWETRLVKDHEETIDTEIRWLLQIQMQSKHHSPMACTPRSPAPP